ncbi:unnamed protein product [Periconia digitata]|uniref:Ima1 N-terminal domain-containing protein n=1 Tax=Periconia digitata TaxID=1303443 RepID=A0A9W4XN54_9PLEO|nr:unnamed protein product [Periconia digitata]
MPRLLRRNLRCHYCNAVSRNPQPGEIPRQWRCPSCESVNFLDERGNIADPPTEATRMHHSSRLQYARSPSPSAYQSAESPFCETCHRNQFLLRETLAEYIPDEDDPQYAKYLASADTYRAELEERYPQVCDNCIGPVQDRIRAAGYAAKADNLKRRLVESKKYRSKESTARQRFTLAVIAIAQWAYVLSVFAGLLWHAMGMAVLPEHAPLAFDWTMCAKQALSLRRINELCVNSFEVLDILKYALLADLLTVWWNPKLRQKTNYPGGRMHNLFLVWGLRIITLVTRYLSYISLRNVEENTADWYRCTHAIFFAILLCATLAAWNFVRISHQSTRSLLQPLDAHLPSLSSPKAERSRPKTPRSSRPITSSFDTMAESFTSSFMGGPSSAYPPSPTLTDETSTTEDSEWTATPYSNLDSTARKPSFGEMAMDWTPTRRRFGSETPTIIPHSFPRHQQQPQQQPPPPSPTPQNRNYQQHSLFSQPDPNPFRHRIPAAPPRSLGPSNRSTRWNLRPLSSSTTPQNPFQPSSRNQLFGSTDDVGVDTTDPPDWSVPKNVKREDELFAKPQFKYDGYALGHENKDTGLEQGFNDLFSK